MIIDKENRINNIILSLNYSGGSVINCINSWSISDMRTTKVGVQSIVTRGPSGTGFWIDWGDGSAWQWVTHVGTSTDVTTTHTYANVGTKYQRWIGELHKIAYVSIHSQSYSFNIASFSYMTALTSLIFYNCPLLTGNISAFSSLTALTSLICYDITNLGYTTATLPIWVNTVLRFDNTGLSTAEVDQIILDVNAVGKSGGSLNVAGTSNGPYTRGGAVAAAIVALTGRGCPVTAN